MEVNTNSVYSTAINALNNGRNVFIYGAAGTGKSYLLSQIVNYYNALNVFIVPTAATAIAAKQFGARTIHSAFGLRPNDNAQTYTRRMNREIKHYKIVIIDEISMVTAEFFETVLDAIAKEAKESNLPFGGIQMVLCGDWLQLPPIPAKGKQTKYVFETNLWNKLNLYSIKLTVGKRQQDPVFYRMLCNLRTNNIDGETEDYFMATDDHKIEGQYLELHSTNREVDRINTNKLIEIESKEFNNRAKVEFDSAESYRRLIESCPAEEMLTLKEGCQVMIIKNIKDSNVVNGDLGTFLYYSPLTRALVVKIANRHPIELNVETWEYAEPRDQRLVVLAKLKQYPVKALYAATFHKTQGVTVDKIKVDCKNMFAPHMLYIGASRCKSYEGLQLIGFDRSCIKYHAKALEFDRDYKFDVVEVDSLSL